MWNRISPFGARGEPVFGFGPRLRYPSGHTPLQAREVNVRVATHSLGHKPVLVAAVESGWRVVSLEAHVGLLGALCGIAVATDFNLYDGVLIGYLREEMCVYETRITLRICNAAPNFGLNKRSRISARGLSA